MFDNNYDFDDYDNDDKDDDNDDNDEIGHCDDGLIQSGRDVMCFRDISEIPAKAR